jgi:hypothetical protein
MCVLCLRCGQIAEWSLTRPGTQLKQGGRIYTPPIHPSREIKNGWRILQWERVKKYQNWHSWSRSWSKIMLKCNYRLSHWTVCCFTNPFLFVCLVTLFAFRFVWFPSLLSCLLPCVFPCLFPLLFLCLSPCVSPWVFPCLLPRLFPCLLPCLCPCLFPLVVPLLPSPARSLFLLCPVCLFVFCGLVKQLTVQCESP